MRFLSLVLVAVTAGLVISTTATAQDRVKVSGLAFLDYYYMVNSPDADEEGDNGFTYRRLYLTTDFKISDRFKSRARLETKGSSTTPFVKDLYLQWSNIIGEGHNARFGVTSPPSYTVSEKVWGYRSLDKTIQDRVKVVSSRDFGVTLSGPIVQSGMLKYSVMVANNNGVTAEDDKYKRLYGQLELYPSEGVAITVGADYAAGDEVDNTNINGFAGFSNDEFSVGLEGFVLQSDDVSLPDLNTFYGVSAFGSVNIDEKWSIIGRFDHTDREIEGVNVAASYALGAISYSPEKNIRIMPNVIYGKTDGDDSSSVTGRLTIEAKL